MSDYILTGPAKRRAAHFCKKGVGLCCFALALPLSAQVPGSALDLMLQRPKVAKHFDGKTFGDHLFLEGGLGLNAVATGSSSALQSPGFATSVAVGDWVTPLHGWRVGLRAGTFKLGDNTSKAVGLSADYLLNLTALAAPTRRDSTYSRPKAFEVYGVAGIDLYHSRLHGDKTNAPGFRLGLRGQQRLSSYTYIYVEPSLGVYADDLLHEPTWRGYRFAAQLSAGLGYRLNPAAARGDYATGGHFLDDTFISFTGGPSTLLHTGGGGLTDNFGGRAGGYIGKWFDAYSGLRLGAGAALYKQDGPRRVKALSLSAGYLWNMHNTFGGYDPSRRFSVYAVADASLNASGSGDGKKFTPGIGGGLQANFRVADGVDFYLEPRVDAFAKNYAVHASSTSGLDIAGSLMAGFTFRQGLDTREQLSRNDDFELQTPYDQLFFEGGVGGLLPVTKSALSHPFTYVRPQVFAGVGKWFTATSGVRLWAEAGQIEPTEGRHLKTAAVGADYLWNLSNAFHGYRPDRRFELIGTVGANVAFRARTKKPYPGVQAGLQGLWHVNEMWGLFIEPRARLYSKNYMPAFTTPGLQRDVTASLVAGLKMSLHGYRPADYSEAFAETDRKGFLSVAVGTYTRANSLRVGDAYGAAARMSYGRWYTPISAWRLNLTGLGNPRQARRYAGLLLGGDYMADFSAMTFGYDEDRIVTVRGLAGLNLGADYERRKAHFVADIHAGGQLGVRTGRNVELYLEPQAAYRLDNRYDGRWPRITPMLLAGVNYRFTPSVRAEAAAAPATRHFAGASSGTGLHSATVGYMSPACRKFTLDFDLFYGQWVTAASGWRAGLSNTSVQVRGRGNFNVTALHADYLRNLLSSTGASTAEAAGFRLSGFAGVTAAVGSRRGYSPTWALGMEAGFQAGWAFTPNWELFLEPTGTIMQKTIYRNSSRPVEAQARLMLGTKVNF